MKTLTARRAFGLRNTQRPAPRTVEQELARTDLTADEYVEVEWMGAQRAAERRAERANA